LGSGEQEYQNTRKEKRELTFSPIGDTRAQCHGSVFWLARKPLQTCTSKHEATIKFFVEDPPVLGTPAALRHMRFAAVVARLHFVVHYSNHQKAYIVEEVVGCIAREVVQKPIRSHTWAIDPGGDVDGPKYTQRGRKPRRLR